MYELISVYGNFYMISECGLRFVSSGVFTFKAEVCDKLALQITPVHAGGCTYTRALKNYEDK